MTYEEYEAILCAWAARDAKLAAEAEKSGDERGRSLYLMQASMYGNMLLALGKVEINGLRKGVLSVVRAQCEAHAEKLRALGDFDAADRERVKAETILRAERALKGEAGA